MNQRKDGLARYENVGDDYLHKRKLKKSAGWLLLWSMGVGAVISGNYFGWNLGLCCRILGHGRRDRADGRHVFVHWYSALPKASAVLPHAGGFYSFARNAMGPTAGFDSGGVTDTIEYILSPAVIVVGIGGYLNTLIFGSAPDAAPAWTRIAVDAVLWFVSNT